MKPQTSTVRARFDGKELVVFDQGPELPPSHDPLLHYLNALGLGGWRAVKAKFDGWEVTLAMEQQSDPANKTGTAYMIPILHQSPTPGGHPANGTQHKRMMEDLQKSGTKEGWEVLAAPKQFSIGAEMWTISIWARGYTKK